MSQLARELSAKQGLFVCSTGGHLEQAIRRAHQLGIHESVTFVTFQNSQSESRLENYSHEFIKLVGTRDPIGVVLASFKVFRIAIRLKSQFVISTGAGIALGCVLASVFLRIKFIYVESIARQHSPSLTGRILESFKWVDRYSESDHFDRTYWRSLPTIFSQYDSAIKNVDSQNPPKLRIFVTVGTHDQYDFPRIIKQVLNVIHPSDDVFWQLGNRGFADDLPGTSVDKLSSEEFLRILATSDVVISHAGVGSILNILDAGFFPILLPRRADLDEHVDNHQIQIALKVEEMGLGLCVQDELTRSHIVQSWSASVRKRL